MYNANLTLLGDSPTSGSGKTYGLEQDVRGKCIFSER